MNLDMDITFLKMRSRTTLSTFLVFILAFRLLALEDVKQGINSHSQIGFEENKGQFSDDRGNEIPKVFFRTFSKGFGLYISDSGLTYVFTKSIIADKAENVNDSLNSSINTRGFKVEWNRMDMILQGAKICKARVLKDGLVDEVFSNYYYSNCPNGVLAVKRYQKVTFKEVYPGIDWVIYFKNDRVEYDFIVKVGANPKQIRMCYRGAESINLTENGKVLNAETGLGKVVEGNVFSYQSDTKKEVKTVYSLIGNTLTFNIGQYDRGKELIIDPPLIWATYCGGTGVGGYGPDAFTSIATGFSPEMYM